MADKKKQPVERKPRIGISSCLLGNLVRYDGGHARDDYLTGPLGKYVEWVPVCPEVESGMPVPRDPMRLVKTDNGIRLITIETGRDQTPVMKRWLKQKLPELGKAVLDGFIFKSRSPSSGMGGVKVFSPEGRISGKSPGIFASAFMEAFPDIPCEDEARLRDPGLRDNFIERVVVMSRWNGYAGGKMSVSGLMDFHARMKYLLMAHSIRHYRELGRMVAVAKKAGISRLHGDYIAGLMEGLRVPSTLKKNENVLMHIMGYFKKDLSEEDKREMLEAIGDYRKGLVPLMVPVTLLNHHVRKYDQKYLRGQSYLNPSPAELMLRNHA